ncbi:transporter substrate-binding domain-containing protein, partial [Pseudomonas frederiksbergensis]|nr:transporter substrate-binding domain-containing protein [Pseudomonas frederiksbergensis]
RDPQDPKHLMGANVDLFKQVASELGLKVEVLDSGSRSQALEEVRSGRVDLLIDSPFAVAELTTVDYVHPALLNNEYVVWTRHDSTLVYNTLA